MILQTLFLSTLLKYGMADSISVCGNDQPTVSKIVNSFGFRMEQMIGNQSNYFFSPLSISVALAMVYIGTRGITKEQMSEALDYNIFGSNCLPNKISEHFLELISALQIEGDGYSFLIANGAFIQAGFPVSQFYSSNLEKYFNSNVNFLNFAREDMESMQKINDWVTNHTNGKISEILNEPPNPMTVMVLLNAIYFKGLWDLPFDEDFTRDRKFYGFGDNEKTIPFMMMRNMAYTYYDEKRQVSVLELEYIGGNVSMIILLPQNEGELPNYQLTNDYLCEIREKLEYKTVLIFLPKFNMEFQRELTKDMMTLGIQELFSDRADLTGISEGNDLHVSIMMHKAVIEVNEKGSKAAAVLEIAIDGRKKGSSDQVFLADHPFLFYIIHKETDTILFSGRLVDP